MLTQRPMVRGAMSATFLFFLVFFGVFCACSFVTVRSLCAQVTPVTKTFSSATFGEMGNQVADRDERNLLVYPGAKLVRAEQVSNVEDLTDGNVGGLGTDGRVAINGHPSTIVYYLGQSRSIKEIVVYSGNGDQRGNQDFEIRLANHAPNTGKEPNFPMAATFTSGDKVLGGNTGGTMTSFTAPEGSFLGESDGGQFNWIEFRFWRTYPDGRAGSPAKTGNKSTSWSSLVELQVLADPNDETLFASPLEKKTWIATRNKTKFPMKRLGLSDDAVRAVQNPGSVLLAINDLGDRFPEKYDAQKYRNKYETIVGRIAEFFGDDVDLDNEATRAKYIAVVKDFDTFRRDALLANPLMNFGDLVVRKAKNHGFVSNWISNCARGKGDYGNSLIRITATDIAGTAKTLIEGPQQSFIGDLSLHWNADKMLVTALADDKTWQIFELSLDGTAGRSGLRQVTPSMGRDVDNVEGCYVPDGAVIFVSSANMMGVPCINGGSPVGNLYRLESDGKRIRQLTFEQDQDWCPVILQNGRIMYLRWEYTDIAHYFSRILFTMNPDGTNQVEHYGSGSYWPNSLFYAKPVPGHQTKFAGIVTGHHGVAREGELVIFDPAKSRFEADGVVQRIPGYGQKVEPVIVDQLVNKSFPKFTFPSPLHENYYLVSCRLTPNSPWGIYLVDIFDNLVKLREEPGYHLLEPTPLIARPEPTMIAPRVDEDRTDANVFITDVYFGKGLEGVPPGTVKKLRVFEYSFGYRGIGGHDLFGMESCWDARRILGEVPVYEDGSASFIVPANKPLAVQPLDEKGRALQLMRSWFVTMPGENAACIGCHETQNSVTPARQTMAATKAPTPMTPFLGTDRPFSYEAEIQPILNKYCVGCHDGSENYKHTPNFADRSKSHAGFSASYHALHPFVRRPGPESDLHVLRPMEYHTNTSELFQKLEKGHGNVKMDDAAWRTLYAWADLNVPYHGTWIEIANAIRANVTPTIEKVADRYVELKKLYANDDLNYETDSYLNFDKAKDVTYIKPEPRPKADYTAPSVANWPFDLAMAKKMQGDNPVRTVKVGREDVPFVRIPAGSFVMGDDDKGKGSRDELPRCAVSITKPFWMMDAEVSNALFAEFDSDHDSRFIDQWWKDHTTPGYPANKPEQPVIRISWQEAVNFCKWVSEKTGKTCRLPTEAEWEWACRAGSATPFWYGTLDTDFSKFANFSDESTRLFVVKGVNPQPVKHENWQAFIPRAEGINDGQMYSIQRKSYLPNPWGLYDMHGSVAEWTQSTYKPYPYSETDGRNSGDITGDKVVRGGSWYDRPRSGRSGTRLEYPSWQKVYNVGFRVVMED